MKHIVPISASLVLLISFMAIIPSGFGASFPNSKEVKSLTNDQFVKQAMLWESYQHVPQGSVLINATLNEWCVENCGQLSKVDPTLFATEATQKAKLQRTADFLNWTFSTSVSRGSNHVAVNSIYCDAMHSILYKGTYLFTC